jgi:hypothetical protein
MAHHHGAGLEPADSESEPNKFGRQQSTAPGASRDTDHRYNLLEQYGQLRIGAA